MIVSQDPFYVA